MLVIRLFRTGKKNQPFFKIVVTEKTKPPRAGRFVEEVGFYNPLTKEKGLKAERIKHWFSLGAKPSPTLYNLLVAEKIIEGEKIAVHKKSKKEPAPSADDPEKQKEEKPASSAEPTDAPEEKKEEKPLKEDKSSSRPSPSEEGPGAEEKPAQEEKTPQEKAE